jgi:hypothetical protein
MLLAAACCIPASLSLLYLVPQVIRLRKQTRATDNEILDTPIEGTNVTVREMQGVNQITRIFLSVIELPFFMAWLLAILILGEVNLFSRPVIYQTEPFANVGMYNLTSMMLPVFHVNPYQVNGARLLEFFLVSWARSTWSGQRSLPNIQRKLRITAVIKTGHAEVSSSLEMGETLLTKLEFRPSTGITAFRDCLPSHGPVPPHLIVSKCA